MFNVGDRVLIGNRNHGVVEQLDSDGKVKLVFLESGCGWWRPEQVKRVNVLPPKMQKAAA